MLYPVMNDLHDLEDLQMLEMDAAKEHASITSIVKTASGELPAANIRSARFRLPGTDKSSEGSARTKAQYYEDVFRGKAKVMQRDDDYQQFMSSRPSVAQRDHWNFLIAKVCVGWGISKQLVFPESMQGTVTRADLDVCSAYFKSRFSVLSGHWTRVYRNHIDWARRNEIELSDAPADWWRVNVRPPRAPNVDVGRNSNALVAEYQAGWRTLESICGELGEDWRNVLAQRSAEIEYATALAAERGLPLDQLLPPPKTAAPVAPEEPATQEDQDEDEPAKKPERAAA